MTKYYDPEFCQCCAEITEYNKPQKYNFEEHIPETGNPTTSNVVTGCNTYLKIPQVSKKKRLTFSQP